MRKKITHILWALTIAFIIGTGLFFTAIWNGWIGYVPPIEELESPINKYASQVLSNDGELLGTWSYNENRMLAKHDDIAPCVYNALIATEDKRFYEHSGIDLRSLFRAVVKRAILHQMQAGGGSTITQQLAKQLYSSAAQNSTERVMQKAIEWIIAIKLEHYYSKNEILTLYLNYFDFLHHAVGIRSAAKIYFNKQPSELSIPEAAMLVGMCKNPSYYNPIRNPERTAERRNIVLKLMAENGYISEIEADAYMKQDLGLNFQRVSHNDGIATYFREYLRQIMMARNPERSDYYSELEYNDAKYEWDNNPLYGWCNKHVKNDGSPYNIYTDGLKIHTTIDSRMQRYAEQAMREHLIGLQRVFSKEKRGTAKYPYAESVSMATRQNLIMQAIRQSDRYRQMKANGASEEEIMQAFNKKVPLTVFTYHGDVDTTMTPLDSLLYHKSFLQAGFMAMDPTNGFVKAYVGGINFNNFKYDMCSQGHRQVGSTIKPYLYSLAMENGMTPCDLVPNQQHTYGNWTPRNGSNARYGEMVPLKWALAQSNNWISAYLINKYGPGALVQIMKNFGIRHNIENPNLTLCLGTCEISVKEMVSAYTAFANHGMRVAPLMVTSIEDNNGTVIERFHTSTNEAISSSSAYRMVDMLKAVIDQGTGRRLRGRYAFTAEIAGKTGTTQKNSDGWFVGMVPRLVAGCWVGGENRNIHFNSTAMGQGASMALPIWALFIKKVFNDPTLGYSPKEKFQIPSDFKYCDDSVLSADSLGTGEAPEDFYEITL